jgi:hypothetical protein
MVVKALSDELDEDVDFADEMLSLTEAKDSLHIDKHALDEMVCEHPDLYEKVSTRCALACSLRDQQKFILSKTESDVAYERRKEWGVAGVKFTESMVKEVVAVSKELEKETKLYLRYKRDADIWQGVKDAYEQRGRMLRDLTQLYIAGYYTASSTSGKRSLQRQDPVRHEDAADEARRGMSHYRARPIVRQSRG